MGLSGFRPVSLAARLSRRNYCTHKINACQDLGCLTLIFFLCTINSMKRGRPKKDKSLLHRRILSIRFLEVDYQRMVKQAGNLRVSEWARITLLEMSKDPSGQAKGT